MKKRYLPLSRQIELMEKECPALDWSMLFLVAVGSWALLAEIIGRIC